MEEIGGAPVKYRDKSYNWLGAIDQGCEYSTCPCSKSGKKREHRVIQDVICGDSTDEDIGKTLYDVFEEIHLAIDSSGSKQPRSAIREHLLMAILRLNDAILPIPMQMYVDAELEKLKENT